MRFRAALVIVLVLLSTNCTIFANRSSRVEWHQKETAMAQVYLREGIKFYDERQYNQALVNFDLAAVWDPDNHEIAAWLGKAQQETQKKKLAELVAIGEEYYKNGNYLEALGTFEQVLALDSTNQTIKTYKEQARLQVAIKPPSPGRQKHERSQLITEYLAEGLEEFTNARYEPAIAAWQKVLKLAPDNQTALAYIEKAKNRYEQTIVSGLAAIDSLAALERLLSALQACDSLLQFAPDDRRIVDKHQELKTKITDSIARHYNAGTAKFNQGDYAGAENEFRKVLIYDSENAAAKNYLQQIKAKKNVDRADAEKFYYLGIEAYTADDFLTAIAYWQRVLDIEPGHSRALKNIERARTKLTYLGG